MTLVVSEHFIPYLGWEQFAQYKIGEKIVRHYVLGWFLFVSFILNGAG